MKSYPATYLANIVIGVSLQCHVHAVRHEGTEALAARTRQVDDDTLLWQARHISLPVEVSKRGSR